MSEPRFLFRAADIAAAPELEGRHPLNPRSRVRGVSLSEACGLERVGLHRLRLGPGEEANELHTHHFEEEFHSEHVLEPAWLRPAAAAHRFVRPPVFESSGRGRTPPHRPSSRWTVLARPRADGRF